MKILLGLILKLLLFAISINCCSKQVKANLFLSSAAEDYTNNMKAEWSEYLGGASLKYTTKSIQYSLDLSPDHVNAIPQLIHEKIHETPSIGRIIYLNSFAAGAKGKALSAVQTYQTAGFVFISLPECL